MISTRPKYYIYEENIFKNEIVYKRIKLLNREMSITTTNKSLES